MIQYLQSLRAKKGFTLIELIVVIAIIAVLMAVILPNVGTDKERKEAADMRAREFYSSVQYIFTKYSKYEAPLSPELKTETDIISYLQAVNGNYPTNKYTFLEMYVKNGVISHIRFADTLTKLFDNSATGNEKLEKHFTAEIESILDSEVDGYYYALIEYEHTYVDPTDPNKIEVGTVKVHSTYYTERDFDIVTGTPDDYRLGNLLFADDNELSNGEICGVCSSRTGVAGGTGLYIGTAGTYFMDMNSTLTVG